LITQTKNEDWDEFAQFLGLHIPKTHTKTSIEYMLEFCKDTPNLFHSSVSEKLKNVGYNIHVFKSGEINSVYTTLFSKFKINPKKGIARETIESELYQNLDLMYETLAHGGELLLCVQPRDNFSTEDLHNILNSCFWSVERQLTTQPIWVCIK